MTTWDTHRADGNAGSGGRGSAGQALPLLPRPTEDPSASVRPVPRPQRHHRHQAPVGAKSHCSSFRLLRGLLTPCPRAAAGDRKRSADGDVVKVPRTRQGLGGQSCNPGLVAVTVESRLTRLPMSRLRPTLFLAANEVGGGNPAILADELTNFSCPDVGSLACFKMRVSALARIPRLFWRVSADDERPLCGRWVSAGGREGVALGRGGRGSSRGARRGGFLREPFLPVFWKRGRGSKFSKLTHQQLTETSAAKTFPAPPLAAKTSSANNYQYPMRRL